MDDRAREPCFSLVVPPDEPIQCPIIGLNDRCGLFSCLKDLRAHIDKLHGSAKVSWTCRACDKIFEKYMGIAVHMGKCKGVNDIGTNVQNMVACESCGEKFGYKRGLAAH